MGYMTYMENYEENELKKIINVDEFKKFNPFLNGMYNFNNNTVGDDSIFNTINNEMND